MSSVQRPCKPFPAFLHLFFMMHQASMHMHTGHLTNLTIQQQYHTTAHAVLRFPNCCFPYCKRLEISCHPRCTCLQQLPGDSAQQRRVSSVLQCRHRRFHELPEQLESSNSTQRKEQGNDMALTCCL